MIETLHIVPLSLLNGDGAPRPRALERLAAALHASLSAKCTVATDVLTVDFAADTIRNQAHSTSILAKLQSRPRNGSAVVLGVTDLDLYVPILTFVFGEAQLNGSCAVISGRRLRQEYYGLPPDEDLLTERLHKEALHELGHTKGLRHCADWRCVMSSAHTVERVDLRQAGFCRDCAMALR